MDNALALAESSTLGLLTLITGATPPSVIRELLLPPLEFDMSVPTPQTQNEPSSATRSPPVPIKTQTLLTDPTSVDSAKTPPTAGPGAYDLSVIPPSHDARTLVICFDGTGDQFDADNSNIVQFFSMLKKDDKSQQMVYYQAGIGTYTIPEIATPFMAKLRKTIDMAIANHLDAHVMGGYEFLMENYHAEDKICIFGFSRGAYTARALAGMIQKVGLLPTGNHQQIPFAYKMFSRDDDVGWSQSTAFKKAFSVDVEIEFVGVWDTVASVGIVPRTLPFTASNTAIRYFRHAISLDEHRAKFKANHWHLLKSEDEKGTKLGEMPRSNQRHPHFHSRYHHIRQHNKVCSQAEVDFYTKPTETNVLEVWFAGVHCDVGGGSVPNGARNSLARIPLRWMIRQCFLANTGIQFHREAFKEIGMDPTKILDTRPPALKASAYVPPAENGTSAHAAEPTEGTLTDEVQASPTAASTFKSEEDEELVDALSPIYDELQLSWGWWILEVLPIRHRHQDREGLWHKYWSMNLGRPRRVPEPIRDRGEKVYVHRSVRTRMEAENLKGGKYVPRAKFEQLDYEWVD
ncbi:hypothetical protein BJV74DRAFT_812169 [Russula compacta]|nr:hypothetical protein BJV74DRAFT_812169 [Russula compacta]